jgi:hypothetical protein
LSRDGVRDRTNEGLTVARRLFIGVLAAITFGLGSPAQSAAVVEPPATHGQAVLTAATVYRNCTALRKTYPHGVGRTGARDHVSGSTKPVTTFTVNTTVYNANKGLDRDRDGIACEQR